MLEIIEQALKVLTELIKNPRLLLYLTFILVLGYSVYSIEQMKLERKNSKYRIGLLSDAEFQKIYNSATDDITYKQILAMKFVRLCDNNKGGSCISSLWHFAQRGTVIEATNYFVVNCSFVYENKKHYCGKDLSLKYTTTLKKLEIPKDFFNKVRNNSSSCDASTWEDIKNMKGSNFAVYSRLLDIKIGRVSMCTYDNKIIILTQKKGHDSTRVGKNLNVGCVDPSCLLETMELMSEYKKIPISAIGG